MKHTLLLVLLVVLVLNAVASPATAFIEVTVIPMDRERLLEDQNLIVRDGRIIQIGRSKKVKVPATPAASREKADGCIALPNTAS